jgi:CDP-glucose 4,6-dehydratase
VEALVSAAPRRVLVTGAHGMIGAALAAACLRRGDAVCVLRRTRRPGSALVLEGTEARCTVIEGDLLDAGVADRAVGDHEIDTVFHLAAQPLVGVANADPVATFEANVRGTWLLLDACRAHGVARTVLASSAKLYGPDATPPYDEAMALDPRYAYDVSKAAADLIARSYHHTFGLPVTTLRLTNVYGGGDANASRLVPGAIASALRGRSPVVRSDGTAQRDLLHLDDAVAAYLALADALPGAGVAGEAFNAGSGRPRAVLDVVQLVCAIAGSGVRPDVRGRGTPPGELDREWIDAGRLRAATGWEPRVELEDGVRRTVAWYERHPEGLPEPEA